MRPPRPLARTPVLLGPALAASLLGAAGCRRDTGDENLGVQGARRDVAVDVSQLGRPGELEKALALPSAEIEKRLGGYRFRATSKLTLAAVGGPVAEGASDLLDETFLVECDGKGGAHLLHDNSHGYGTEAVAAGGRYAVRPRYASYATRNPEGDEVERARDEVEGVLGGYLAVLGRFAARQVGREPADWNGRPSIRVKLMRESSPSSFDDPDPAHAWRGTIAVKVLDGDLWIDAKTGVLLHAIFDVKYGAIREQRQISVGLHHESSVSDVGAVPPIAIPEAATAARVRPLLDRQILLDGLAPLKGIKRLDEGDAR